MTTLLTPPDNLLPWLTYTKFLTGKLYDKSKQTELTVLNQQWQIADWWDRSVLGLDFVSVLHREIITSARGEPCWYARTILPKKTYESNSTLFDRLKTEPLGHLIFNENVIARDSLQYYAINRQHIEFHWLTPYVSVEQDKVLWVRRSIFTLACGSKFYLIEILLPPLEQYL